MHTNEQTESNLARLGARVSLTPEEKREGRAALAAFMRESRKPVRSPYMAWVAAPAFRFAGAFVALLAVATVGFVSAEQARPGDALYRAKLSITEPAQAAFAFTPEDRTAFAVERTDRRLKEFAEVAATENPDQETVALINESLSESIATASENVAALAASGEADEALKANADLQSVLTAHSLVLDSIDGTNPGAAANVEAVAQAVDTGIAGTENAEGAIEDALTPLLADSEALATQAEDARDALAAIRARLAEGGTLDARDGVVVTDTLASAEATLREAEGAQANGASEDAFILYTEALQRLTELMTLIEADESLGIGVIDADAPPAP